MIKVYDDFNENGKGLDLACLLHFTYLHGKVDRERGCDIFGVLMSSVDPEKNIYLNYARGSKNYYRVYVEDINDLVKVARLVWFPVEVADYAGQCVCVLKEWRYEENIKHSGVIVDVTEWDEGLDYVKNYVFEGTEFTEEYWAKAKEKLEAYVKELTKEEEGS